MTQAEDGAQGSSGEGPGLLAGGDRGGASRPGLRDALLVAVLVILLGWALKALSVVLVPLAAAVLIALAVMPVRDRVRALVPARLGWIGPMAAMALILVVLALFFGGLFLAAQQLAAKAPEASERIAGMLGGEGGASDGEGESVSEGAAEGAADAVGEGGLPGQGGDDAPAGEGTASEGEASEGGASEGEASEGGAGEGGEGGGGALAGLLGGAEGDMRGAVRALGESALGAAGGAAGALLNAGLSILAGLVLVFFLTLLLLFESADWARKAAALLGRRAEWRMLESAEVVAAKARSYVLVQTGLGATTGLLYAAWLWVWGVDLILVWSLLTFLMNFVPTLGSIVAGATTTAYALITVDFGTAVLVGAGILSIEQVMGNLVAPQVQSRNIALSPFVVLVALLFWGWAWGIAGALLAVPMTFALVVVGAHVPALRPWALLLTDRTTMKGLEEATTP